MSKERQIHRSKSLEERRNYIQTVIRSPGPTLEDTSPIIDSTDSSATTERGKNNFLLTPTKPPTAIRRLLKERSLEIIVVSVLVPLLFWGGCQLFMLNREVGELRSSVANDKEALTNLESQIDKVENRLKEQIGTVSLAVNRLEQRIDGLVDRNPSNTYKSSNKKRE